jgi:Reverse transcriptase (RNA-dependent DNA polymerase)
VVGAGLGCGFVNTQELHVMKFKEAMAGPEADKWEVAVNKEHARMVKSEVFKATLIAELPDGATVLSETWAMKKKVSGDHRARVTARGFKQIDGEHFDMNDKAAPVVTEATICIVFTLILMAAWYAYVLVVVGAFLLGKFDPKHKMHMRVPRGFEKIYPDHVVLLLMKTLYGARQAAMAFWKELCKVFKLINITHSQADPSLCYNWTVDGLVVWITWVDDCIIAGPENQVRKSKEEMMKHMECEEAG